jgi:hypothetical protein
LNLILRMERCQRPPSLGLMQHGGMLISESGLDLESATGFWNMASIWVRFNNFFAHTLPPWPDVVQPSSTSPRTNGDQILPCRPIASATRVTIQSGEALTDVESRAVPGSPARGQSGLAPHRLSPGDRFHVNNLQTYAFLLWKHLLCLALYHFEMAKLLNGPRNICYCTNFTEREERCDLLCATEKERTDFLFQ